MTSPLLLDLPPVLLVREAATVLRCSPAHVYQLVQEGSLPAVSYATAKPTRSAKLKGPKRGTVRVLASDLRDFIERQRRAR